MNTDQVLYIAEPTITSFLERLSKFNKAESRDVVRLGTPSCEVIARAANLEPAVLTDWLATQGPDTISRESIHAFVRSLTEAPAVELEAARARQEQIEREISAKPLSARDKVLMERSKPIAERSRQSIAEELNEVNTGRMADGTELPHIDRRHWDALEPHFKALEIELERRDCAVAGIPYSGDREKPTGMVGYAMSPR